MLLSVKFFFCSRVCWAVGHTILCSWKQVRLESASKITFCLGFKCNFKAKKYDAGYSEKTQCHFCISCFTVIMSAAFWYRSTSWPEQQHIVSACEWKIHFMFLRWEWKVIAIWSLSRDSVQSLPLGHLHPPRLKSLIRNAAHINLKSTYWKISWQCNEPQWWILLVKINSHFFNQMSLRFVLSTYLHLSSHQTQGIHWQARAPQATGTSFPFYHKPLVPAGPTASISHHQPLHHHQHQLVSVLLAEKEARSVVKACVQCVRVTARVVYLCRVFIVRWIRGDLSSGSRWDM